MALDSNLFTLSFMRREESPSIVDLFSLSQSHLRSLSTSIADLPSSSNGVTPLYTRHRALASPLYDSLLLDGAVEAPLASLTASSTSDKKKEVKLHNPEAGIWIEKKGSTFHQDWCFDWEGESFYWRKDSSVGGKNQYNCFASRKPDPSISVAIYRPSTKNRPALMQLFDYNLSRFDIFDKRGLELLFIISLFSLLDLDYDEKNKDGSNMYVSNMVGAGGVQKTGSLGRRPDSREGQSLLQSSSPNEIPITSHGDPSSYVSHALSLLKADDPQAPGLSLIVLKSNSQETSQKAIKVSAEVKNAYYRLPQKEKGEKQEEELFLYVRQDEEESRKGKETDNVTSNGSPGRRRIKLDGPSPSTVSPPSTPRASYQPPTALSIYLSKSRLHEFEPKAPQPKPRIPPKSIPAPSGAFPNPRASNPLAPALRPWLMANSNSGSSLTNSTPTSAPMTPSTSGGGTGARLLGKLGIGKSRESSEEGKK